MQVVEIENHFENDEIAGDFAFNQEDAQIIKVLESNNYAALDCLGEKTLDKDCFAKKIFNYWKAMRIREFDKVLEPSFHAFASLRGKERSLEIKELFKKKGALVGFVSSDLFLAPVRSVKPFKAKDKKSSENVNSYKEISFGFFTIESKRSQCWFHLKKFVTSLEVRNYAEDGGVEGTGEKKAKIILKAKNTKHQKFVLDVGYYNIDINGNAFFIEIMP